MASELKLKPIVLRDVSYYRNTDRFCIEAFNKEGLDLKHGVGICRTWYLTREQIEKLKKHFNVKSAKALWGKEVVGVEQTPHQTNYYGF